MIEHLIRAMHVHLGCVYGFQIHYQMHPKKILQANLFLNYHLFKDHSDSIMTEVVGLASVLLWKLLRDRCDLDCQCLRGQ